MNIDKNRKVHFIGIGGIGMSGIAEVLLTMGFRVSGSDTNESKNVQKLRKMGAEIFIGHKEENINSDLVVYSSAINEENPEIKKARKLGLPILRRAEILADLMRLKSSIAVAGAHGKTTTTSLVATIFYENLKDPSYIIGGIVKNLDGHAYLGKGEFLIAEADESDGSFLLLNPQIAILTNIDNDHLDFYKSKEKIHEAFFQFCNKIPFYGWICANNDDEILSKILKDVKKPIATFGIDKADSDYVAFDIKYGEDTQFKLRVRNHNETFDVKINMRGKHNVYNSLGAIAGAHKCGLQIEDIVKAISKFNGVGRRAQKIFENENVKIFDDYGHHPTEINATLTAFADSFPGKKINLIFEPHRYTRTQNCWDQFKSCFSVANNVFLLPIYEASETPIPGITTDALVEELKKLGIKASSLKYDQLKNVVLEMSKEECILLAMGAGKISTKMAELVDELS